MPERFGHFKENLLTIGFTVYEFNHNRASRLPKKRKVLLTHSSIRDEAQCTIESVSRVPTDLRAKTELIAPGDVSFLYQSNGVRRPALPQTIPSVASEAAPGCLPAACVEQTKVVFQKQISQPKRKRQFVQDDSADVGDGRHKQPMSSSCNVLQFNSRVADAARSSSPEQIHALFGRSQLMELSSWSEIEPGFYYTDRGNLPPRAEVSPLHQLQGGVGRAAILQTSRSLASQAASVYPAAATCVAQQLSSSHEAAAAFPHTPTASAPPTLLPCVSDYRLPGYDDIDMSLNQRVRPVQDSGRQSALYGFHPSQMEPASWSELAVVVDNSLNRAKEYDEMALNEFNPNNFPGW